MCCGFLSRIKMYIYYLVKYQLSVPFIFCCHLWWIKIVWAAIFHGCVLVAVRLESDRCSGGVVDACQGAMECLSGRCRCPPAARPTADRQHCLRPSEKLLRQPCSPTFDTCLHKSGQPAALFIYLYSSNNMIAKQIKKKTKNSKSKILRNKIYRTIARLPWRS